MYVLNPEQILVILVDQILIIKKKKGKYILSNLGDKKTGIVGYWATSISTVRSTVLSKK